MTRRILIGAPVYKRSWILPYWFKALREQEGDYDLGFVFYGARDDFETRKTIEDEVDKFESLWHFSYLQGGASDRNQGPRRWNPTRYEYMTSMRNTLLRVARAHQPDKYFSLDTDILLEDSKTIYKLDVATDSYADAASPLMFMTPDSDRAPSYMSWGKNGDPNAAFRERPRVNYGHAIQVDVIMAAKMMNKDVYNNASYRTHRQGEDLGWSLNCRELGYKLYCVDNLYAAHIMSENMLGAYLEGGDPRKKWLNSG